MDRPDPSIDPDILEIESDPALRVIEEGLPAAAPRHSWVRRHSRGLSALFALTVTAARLSRPPWNFADDDPHLTITP